MMRKEKDFTFKVKIAEQSARICLKSTEINTLVSQLNKLSFIPTKCCVYIQHLPGIMVLDKLDSLLEPLEHINTEMEFIVETFEDIKAVPMYSIFFY